MIAPVLLDTAESRAFLSGIIHDHRLGMWKEEFRTSKYVMAAAKKMYCVVLDSINPHTGKNELKMATKGIPKDVLGEDDFRKLIFAGDKVTAPMGLSFQAGMSQLREHTSITREIQVGNRSRKWIGNESEPWDNVEEFLRSSYSDDLLCVTSSIIVSM
jgi:hypothetical protein